MNLLQIIENIVNILDPLMVLIAIFCWAMGGFMYIKALLQAKARSELGPGQPGGWGAPFATFVTGTVFFAMPEFISILNVSIFDQQSVSANAIFALAPETIGKISTSSGATEKMIAGIVAIIQFVGVIGIMRGVYLLNQSAQGGQGAPTFGPGLTFLIAGAIARMFPLFLGAIEFLVI